MEEDDDDDEEDYLKPDSSPTHTGRPTGPPPSYPPPPVPALSNRLLPQSKAPPLPPPIHHIPTSPHPKKLPPPAIPPHKGQSPPSIPTLKGLPPPTVLTYKGPPPPTISTHKSPPPPTIPPQKGPPPPIITQTPSQKGPPLCSPFASYPQKDVPFSPVTPHLPPPNPRRTVSKLSPGEGRERPLPAAVQICEQLESQLRLNHPAQSAARGPSPSHSPTHTLSQRPAHSSSLGNSCNVQPAAKPGQALTGLKPKPPPPTCKPPVPTSRKPTTTTPLGRASPEGQSFRSSADELPADLRGRWDSVKHNMDRSDDDDDYENVSPSYSVCPLHLSQSTVSYISVS